MITPSEKGGFDKKGCNLVSSLHHHKFHHAAMSQLSLSYPSSCPGQGQLVHQFVEEGISIGHSVGELGGSWYLTGMKSGMRVT